MGVGSWPLWQPSLWLHWLAPPLAMRGGDPYVRALMRTITVSEAPGPRTYNRLYGGGYTPDLRQHPDRCVVIRPGWCSTAAGRYQLLSTTWYEKVQRYHPHPQAAEFAPEFQDQVVYRWLSDSHAWGFDITATLRQGQLTTVLRELSGTWTSLGYGPESNRWTPLLPWIYQHVLREELAQTTQSSSNGNPRRTRPLPK
ncbi:MAG: glycoside hydrolase family protein [Gloeomargarita sp. SKYG116]|nr:glycoside hydrolase family protein [Gloeomargarita sp. SKYG116]MDW8401388.1 glycoside hydrolase family protein [Gloeomargarita sp. SKYGB_i_bin116]